MPLSSLIALGHVHSRMTCKQGVYSGHFYSTSSNPLLLRDAPDAARMLYRSFTPKRHRQLQVKNLPKVPTWRLERDSNLRPFERRAMNLPMSHHAPQGVCRLFHNIIINLIDNAVKLRNNFINRLNIQMRVWLLMLSMTIAFLRQHHLRGRSQRKSFHHWI